MPKQGSRGRYNMNEVWGLVLVFVIVLLLWNTIFIAPLKILVVLFHELSHGIAAVLSGGRVISIEISPLEGGLTTTLGGNQFLTASAGYVGSMLWGSLIILSARFVRNRRIVTLALGTLILAAGLLFVRPIFSFGLLFCLLAGTALILLGRRLDNDWQDFILKLIGVTSCLYALLDIKSDVLDRPHMHSDAVTMQNLSFIPAIIWGLLWIAMSLVCVWCCLRISTRHNGGPTG